MPSTPTDPGQRSTGLAEETPACATVDLEQCLNQVEYYQPLYGIVGFENPLRACRDRALAILAAIGPPRTVRLVDFGSSLGYFPFFFADRGAVATGIDINPANTAVAVATQRLNGVSATFLTAALDIDLVRSIPHGAYDVALLLSVLHHVNHRHGTAYVANLIAELLARVPRIVLELAHRDEDVRFAWRESLPSEPLQILSAAQGASARLLGHFPSHLSAATRPMYLVNR
jgi:O-antigen chain-terminating methyltransferase